MAYGKGNKKLAPTSRAVVTSLKPKKIVGKGSGEMKTLGKSDITKHSKDAKLGRLKSGF